MISNSVPFGLQVGEGLGEGEAVVLTAADGVTLGSEDELVPPPHAAPTAIIIDATTDNPSLTMRKGN